LCNGRQEPGALRQVVGTNNGKEGPAMSDYRNFSDPLYRNPNDPSTGNAGYEPAARTNAGWGWIAGALCLVIILAIAFGVGHEPNRVASNDEAQPAATHMAPPAAALRPAPPAVPGLAPPQEPAPTPDRP